MSGPDPRDPRAVADVFMANIARYRPELIDAMTAASLVVTLRDDTEAMPNGARFGEAHVHFPVDVPEPGPRAVADVLRQLADQLADRA